MHLLVESGCEVCFDGNVVGLSVREVPDGLHSVLTNDRKFLVYTSEELSLIEVCENAKFVSLLSVVSCVYPECSDWRDLSNLISRRTFERCLCAIPVKDQLEIDTFVSLTSRQNDLSCIEIVDEMQFNFTVIPTTTTTDPVSVSSITSAFSQTTIQALNKTHLNASLSLRHILEELQLAFLLFSIYQSEEAYSTFKSHLFHLTHIDCFSSLDTSHTNEPEVQAMRRINPVFTKLCLVLASILKCFPIDFFRDPLSSGSFLEECLRNLYVGLEGVKCVEVLAEVVEGLFMWDMRVLDDDELPTIVSEEDA